MNENLTIVGVDDVLLSVTKSAQSRRDELLARAETVKSVLNVEGATLAAEVLKELKNFARVIEASRADVKAPVILLAKSIDDTAKELTAQIEERAREIGNNLAAWQTEQNRIAEQERRKAWEEVERLRIETERQEQEARDKIAREEREAADRAAKAERERQAIAQQAQKAENDRLAAEKAAQEATNKKQRDAAEALRQKAQEEARIAREAQAKAERDQMQADADAEQRRVQAEAEKAEREQQFIAKAVEVQVAADAKGPGKQAGIATQMETKFEVLDVAALYVAFPHFVTLSPINASIKASLKANPKLELPGVRRWQEAKSIVR